MQKYKICRNVKYAQTPAQIMIKIKCINHESGSKSHHTNKHIHYMKHREHKINLYL